MEWNGVLCYNNIIIIIIVIMYYYCNTPKTMSEYIPSFRRAVFAEWLPRVWRGEGICGISQTNGMKTSLKISSRRYRLRPRNDVRLVRGNQAGWRLRR